ncbi:hypothetical protein RvY_12434 [Ramazzottius varieornatus]|uniref:Phosphatidic acid phosphatase type 2/haloperoxidase domain-containing protein n=1 Tax=Ramazzottius varieornatus TaxID=947166 RepID=A0A1D1VPX8_RAMVA|nr:hypothetical protein RvY_12434 [Ramazzottius varieornatus]
MSQAPNSYIPPQRSKPLPFPTTDLEFQRVQNTASNYIPMTRVSPTHPTPSPSARDVVDSPRVHSDVPYIDANGNGPDYRDEHLQPPSLHALHNVAAPLGTVNLSGIPDLGPQSRYFFSLRTLLESLSILAAAIPIIVAPHIGAYQRGFYCNDPNIMYPYKTGTVKIWVLYIINFGITGLVVIIGEICRFHVSKTGYRKMETPYFLYRNGPRIPPLLVSITRIVVLFAFGFMITKGVTDIAKYAVGRLRPHFLAVCEPDMARINAEGGCNRYITEFSCRKASSQDPHDIYRLNDARLSFMSGHTSMAFYSMFFVIFYLESRLRWMQLRYCKGIIQFGLFLIAALTGMSRISDHKHHWTDVFAGGLVGLIAVIVTVFVVGDFFNDNHFLRYKIASMIQKLDWNNHEGMQYARLLSNADGRDPLVLKKLRHLTRYPANPYLQQDNDDAQKTA